MKSAYFSGYDVFISISKEFYHLNLSSTCNLHRRGMGLTIRVFINCFVGLQGKRSEDVKYRNILGLGCCSTEISRGFVLNSIL